MKESMMKWAELSKSHSEWYYKRFGNDGKWFLVYLHFLGLPCNHLVDDDLKAV